jgi:hypothetical protein
MTITTLTLGPYGSMLVHVALRAAARLRMVWEDSRNPSPENSGSAPHTPLGLEINVYAAGIADGRMNAARTFYPVEE